MAVGEAGESNRCDVLWGITRQARGGPACATHAGRITVEHQCVTLEGETPLVGQPVVIGGMLGGAVGGAIGGAIQGRSPVDPLTGKVRIVMKPEEMEIRHDDSRRIVSIPQGNGTFLVMKPKRLGGPSAEDYNSFLRLLQKAIGARFIPTKLSRPGFAIYLLIVLLIGWLLIAWWIYSQRKMF